MAGDGETTALVFRDETTIHGVKELLGSPRKWHRVVWFLLIAAGIAALSLQLSQVFGSFLRDETGTTTSAFVPAKIPGILFCPRFDYFTSEGNVDQVMSRYINGFLLFSSEFERFTEPDSAAARTLEVARRAEDMMRKAGNSTVRFLTEIAMKAGSVVKKAALGPRIVEGEEVMTSTIVTTFGVCYHVEVKNPIPELLQEVAHLEVSLNDSRTVELKDIPALYFAFVGDLDSVAIQPPLSARFIVFANHTTILKTRVKKRVRYSGRGKDRCKRYARSDERYCINEVINSLCGGCKVQSPPSASYPTSNYPPELLCNYYHYNISRMYCHAQLARDPEGKIKAQCPQPCEELIYDYTHQGLISNGTRVFVTLDDLAQSIQEVEYPLFKAVDLLSALGGTLGLYFGASIMSIVQVVFYTCGTLLVCRMCNDGRRMYRWTD